MPSFCSSVAFEPPTSPSSQAVYSSGFNLRLVDYVVSNSWPGDRNRVAVPISGLREVPLPFQLCGCVELKSSADRYQLPVKLLAPKGEKLVFHYRPAKGAAELILMQRVLRRREEIRCVNVVVTDEFKGRPVIFIGSRAGNDVDQAAGMHPVLRAQGR